MARELAVMAQENNMEFDFKVQDMVMFGRYSHKKISSGRYVPGQGIMCGISCGSGTGGI